MKQKVFLLKSRSLVSKTSCAAPPLGVMYLAACLREHGNADVRILDIKFSRRPEEEIRGQLQAFRPDVVGISAMTAESFMAHKAAGIARALDPGVPVVMGGPYAASEPDAILADPNVDLAVIGEGEETMLELAEVIRSEGPGFRRSEVLRRIAGIAFRNEAGELETTPPRPLIQDLDSLPFPAWDLVDLKSYWSIASTSSMGVRPYFPLFTSRGCPFQCTYCHNIFGKKFRARSAASVLAEIEEIDRRYGVLDFEVFDDVINFDRVRLKEILTGLLARGLHTRLNLVNGVRADLLDEEIILLLKRVGVGEISMGVETASPRLQKMIKKHLNLEKVDENIRIMAGHRMFTRGFFMVGFPTETEEELRATYDFALQSRLHIAIFSVVTPFKNAPMYQTFVEHGKLDASYNPLDYEYFGTPFNASEVPDDLFRRLYKSAYLRFYFNPKRMYRIARDRPLIHDLPLRAYRLLRNYMSFRRLREDEEDHAHPAGVGKSA
jgi:anaerobic magnesium-protoporphyrin IX monomethyl ester cyclase